ncbi:hypothetical protein EVAR_16737_1 [Eumeta japonica]|uniref:Uncharacterized protein n=1 Tax=Eumeta variegata TaxID=151549 RepID=A0A4C1ULM2_EUMVA|nr:hypothetical protein EVAR_16737_1 [Eumeta japonica]
MYSRELAGARQVEPVNQALGMVIFSGVYHKGACPLPCKDVNSLTGIDSGSRRSPTGCKLTHKNRFWLEEEPHKCTTRELARYLQGEKINQALNTSGAEQTCNKQLRAGAGGARPGAGAALSPFRIQSGRASAPAGDLWP